jgi:hypothetical protein
MSSDVKVVFGGDVSDLRDKMEIAQRAVSDSTDQMRRGADAASPAFAQLQQRIDALTEAAKKNASATEGLLSMQKWGNDGSVLYTTYKLLGHAIDGISESVSLGSSALRAFADGEAYLGAKAYEAGYGVRALITEYMDYAKAQAYITQQGNPLQVSNDGFIAAIGRRIQNYEELSNRSMLVANGMAYEGMQAAVTAGQYDRLSAEAVRAGTTVAQIASDLEAKLMSRGTSAGDATGIVKMFEAIPGATLPVQYELTKFTEQLNTTGEDAKKFAVSLASVMTDPSSGGNSYLQSLGGVSEELRSQFDSQQRQNDLMGMRAVILEALRGKMTQLADAEVLGVSEIDAYNRKVVEQDGLWGRLFETKKGASSDEIAAAARHRAELGEQIAKHEQAISRIRQQTTGIQESEAAARNLVNSMNPLEHQLEMAVSQANTLTTAFRNAAKASADIHLGGASLDGHGDGVVGSWWTEDRIQHAAQRLMAEAGLSPSGASGLVARWSSVEAPGGPGSVNPTSGAFGIGQWLGDRKTGIDGNTDFDAQIAHAVAELNGKERTAAAALRSASSSADGARGASMYERAEGYNESTGKDNFTDKTPVDRVSGILAQKRALDNVLDTEQKIRDAMVGGNAVTLAQAAITARNAAGQKDSVQDARDMVTAWERVLSNAHSLDSQIAALNGLSAARVALADKQHAAGVAENTLGASSANSAEMKLALAKQLYDINMKAAGNDSASQDQARAAYKAAQVTYQKQLFDIAIAQSNLTHNDDDESGEKKLAAARELANLQLTQARSTGDKPGELTALLALKTAQDSFDTDKSARDKAAIEAKLALDLNALEMEKVTQGSSLSNHEKMNQSKLMSDISFVDRENALRVAAAQKLEELTSKGSLEEQKAQAAITQAVAAGVTARQQILQADMAKTAQSYQQAFEKIGSTVSTSLMGMIQGTTSFQQMMAKIASQILQDFISMGVKQVADWAAIESMKLVRTVTGQTAQTAAVAAGTAARTATVTAGATAGAAAEKLANASTISGDAAKAGAGAYASVVQIPIIGPVLAPAAAAVAYGATMAFGSYDIGSWSLPHDQLAMVHAGEMIVPSRGGVADEFRSMLGGDGSKKSSGDTHLHVNVSAVDGSSVKQFFHNNSKHMISALDMAVKNGDHSGFRRLGG